MPPDALRKLHDMRDMLNAITLNAGALKMKATDDDSRAACDDINEAAMRIAKMADEILTMVHLQNKLSEGT